MNFKDGRVPMDTNTQDIYHSNYRYDNESSTDEEMSDNDEESSDDDDDFKSKIGQIATKTSQQGKVRIQSNKEQGEEGEEREEEEDEDEFEAEMKKEMDERMQKAEKDAAIANTDLEFEKEVYETEDPGGSNQKQKETVGTSAAKDHYDDIYFDSDDEDKEKGRKVLTNDDLLYDPNMDDDDQSWVDDVRRSYQIPTALGKKKTGDGLKPLPNSDAVLNCPACFTAVCLDCQRHEIYKTQYRAMFVINCSVITDEVMKIPIKKKGKKGKAITHPDDEYHPVRCDQCRTEIAMYDKDEVYHFFNVVASHT